MPKKKTDSNWILDFIRDKTDRPMKIKELARIIGVKPSEYPAFRSEIKELLAEGKLVKLKRGRVGLPDEMDLVTGTIALTKAGFGFVTCDNTDEEVFIAARHLSTSFHGDRVLVRLKPGVGFKGKREGKVIDIIERKTSRLVGTFRKGRGYNVVVPDSKTFGHDISIIPGGTKRARDGEIVLVELEEWVDPNLHPEGKVVERLGFPGEPGVETLTIIRKYELPLEFPSPVEAEAEKVSRDWLKEAERRRDLTGLVTFTIDPIDARDFDDAISIERNESNYRLGVHIADVSHFVRPDSRLDAEALDRATSVYFPDRVIPMLPEKLSNDVCSLRPGRKRLAFTVIIDFTRTGKVISHEVFPSVIKSRARLSYEDVQAYFDGSETTEQIARVADELLIARELARVLHARREAAGSLDFDLPEAKITLDKLGNVIDIGHKIRLEAHRLVEEFMLAANKEVALYFFRRALPTLYRVHDKPDMEKLEAFAELIEKFGYHLTVSPHMLTRVLSEFLEQVKEKPEEELINELLLRSMKKAVYQPKNIGHFGLAFTHYLHFTSPIRRYPDLIVHRLLKEIEDDRYPVELHQKLDRILTNVGNHCSEMERRAMEAEREAVKAKQVLYMSEHIGEEYDGIISGVLNFGFFVRLVGPGAEGLVRVSTLDDDYYGFDEKGYRMVGRRRGRSFRLGDKVRVGVDRVDVKQREVDLFLLQDPQEAKSGKSRKTRSRKKKKQ